MNRKQIDFLSKNISKINAVNYSLDAEGKDLFGNEISLKIELKLFFLKRLEEPTFGPSIIEIFEKENLIKSKIVSIANHFLIYKVDLGTFLDAFYQNGLVEKIDKIKYLEHVLSYIKTSINNDSEFKFIETKISKIIAKQFDFIFSNGFTTNILNINSGVMTANAGDSAQFLFLGRAILAGFNCSNVDVRSSRYDAVVDLNNRLLRIQVKGVSGTTISFKDRDRGGQGIDHKHESNKGKKITSSDCDIYVAVDKEIGICYLIPMYWVDTLTEEQTNNVKLSTLERFKENWNVINDVAEHLFRR